MRDVARKVWHWWNRFFFAPIDLLPLGVFRSAFVGIVFLKDFIRALDWRFYFTNDGLIGASDALAVLPEFYRPILELYPTTPLFAFLLQIVYLATLLLLMIGYGGRITAVTALTLHLAFLQRNYSIVYGADIITSFFLFGLALAKSDHAFSLRRWLESRGDREQRVKLFAGGGWSSLDSMLSTMGVRLIQIQLCVIYGYTGLEKLKGPSWWDGTAVWAVLGNKQLMMLDASWLKEVPILIALMTFTPVIFEIYFPVLVWLKKVRPWLFLYGCLFHVLIGVFVGLYFFSALMMAVYLIYLSEDGLRKRLGRLGVPEALLAS